MCLDPLPHLSVFLTPKAMIGKPDDIQRNSSCNKKNSGKGFHLIKWDTIAKPKVIGWLGSRETQTMNNVLLRKMASRMLNRYIVFRSPPWGTNTFYLIIHCIMQVIKKDHGSGEEFVEI